jgi:hypothetical protein
MPFIGTATANRRRDIVNGCAEVRTGIRCDGGAENEPPPTSHADRGTTANGSDRGTRPKQPFANCNGIRVLHGYGVVRSPQPAAGKQAQQPADALSAGPCDCRMSGLQWVLLGGRASAKRLMARDFGEWEGLCAISDE